MTQIVEAPSLFETPPTASARKNATVTELTGARKASMREGSRRARIMELLDFAPMTDDELCLRLEANPRWWPSVKSARSRCVHVHHEVVGTGRERAGQEVWRRVDRPEHARAMNVIDSL